MKFSDFTGILKKHSIRLRSSNNPHSDYYVFDFDIPKGMTWIPGEHGIFSFPSKKVEGKKWRAFSVASTPAEGFLRIGTHISDNPSGFKKVLRDLQVNEAMSVRGPFGWFKLVDNTTPLVMLAGGVGVTPFRALFKAMEGNNKRDVVYIHSAKGGFLFKDDIESMTANDTNITLHYVSDREEANALLHQQIRKYKSDAYYYISGAEPMIKAIQKDLKSKGIPGKRIIHDPFVGY